METRFFYNPVSKEFINIENSDHAIYWHNKKKDIKLFDKYIRGIIKDNTVYLRLYYPLNDIDNKTLTEIEEYSFNVLFDSHKAVLRCIQSKIGIKVSHVKYNVTNAYLKGILVNI